MAFFSLLARFSSFSATARELGVTTPAVDKRLAQVKARPGVQLLNRTTRRIGLTPEGETYRADIDDMEQLVSSPASAPKGLLRVNATLGFGRSHIAPLISRFIRRQPQAQLQLSVEPPLTDDAFDVCVRFGEPPDARVLARHLAAVARRDLGELGAGRARHIDTRRMGHCPHAFTPAQRRHTATA